MLFSFKLRFQDDQRFDILVWGALMEGNQDNPKRLVRRECSSRTGASQTLLLVLGGGARQEPSPKEDVLEAAERAAYC